MRRSKVLEPLLLQRFSENMRLENLGIAILVDAVLNEASEEDRLGAAIHRAVNSYAEVHDITWARKRMLERELTVYMTQFTRNHLPAYVKNGKH